MIMLPLAYYNASTKKKVKAKGIVYCKDCECLDNGMQYIGFCNLYKMFVGKHSGYCYEVADEVEDTTGNN